MSGSPRTGLVIGVVLALFAGMFIGALGATVLLRTSIGSAGDLKARDAIRLHALVATPTGAAGADEVRERTLSTFAASFVSAAAAIDATASLDDRRRLVDIARWISDTGALSGRDDGGNAAWAEAAARCVVATPDAPRDAAKCVKAAMPATGIAPHTN
ncbi:hypothetical protein LDO26_11550 [Luteimonas sp. BDR2-5]|uniref:hypothetical protein n=1 Tax=Proluteimonas luteida TaxID=2878685 RepID=UPI001E28893A|nr:hypothetical protein [Luteimonas sp. BDR2-5]MCD9028841.1 hypothetical protein [Luteimonas sp. BDR2-5]